MSGPGTPNCHHHMAAAARSATAVTGTTVRADSPSGRWWVLTTPTACSPSSGSVVNATDPDMPSHTDPASEAGNGCGALVTCRESSRARCFVPGEMSPRTCQVSLRLPSAKTGPASPNRGNPTAQQSDTGAGLSRST